MNWLIVSVGLFVVVAAVTVSLFPWGYIRMTDQLVTVTFEQIALVITLCLASQSVWAIALLTTNVGKSIHVAM